MLNQKLEFCEHFSIFERAEVKKKVNKINLEIGQFNQASSSFKFFKWDKKFIIQNHSESFKINQELTMTHHESMPIW